MITPQQLEARRSRLGSSDLSAILGMNPWKTAEDVRLEKAGLVEDQPANESTDAGNYLEPAVRAWACDRLKATIRVPDTYFHDNGIMCAHLDGEIVGDGHEPCEVKTTGITGPIIGNWGNDETDEVPDYNYVQLQSQMACSPFEPQRSYLAALLGGRGFVLYVIRRDDEVIAGIERAAVTFWERHVKGGKPAPNSLATLDVLKRVRRQPGSIMPVSEDLWREVEKLHDESAAAEQQYEKSKIRLLNLIGTAEAVSVDGQVVATYASNKRGVRSFKIKGQ